MKNQKIIAITGYRSFELGIFQAKDPKLLLLYKFIKQSLIEYLENGLEWVVIGGNLGVELWAAEMIIELKKEGYELKLAVILPYLNFGQQWNEKNRELLTTILTHADYINYVSQQDYQNPSQLVNHTHFIIQHVDGLWAIYDENYPGKVKYLVEEFLNYNKKENMQLISMQDLQDFSYNQIME